MTRRLSREEGIFCGGSCGAAVAGAVKWLNTWEKANPGKTLRAVVLLPDSGSRYLSKIYNDKWMEEQGFTEPAVNLGSVRDVIARSPLKAPVTVSEDVSVAEAIGQLKLHGISQLPVTRAGQVVGMLHEKTLLEQALRPGGANRSAGELADANYCTVDLDTELATVTDLLRRAPIALVLDAERKITGVLARIDIIDHIARLTGGNA